MMLAWPKCGSAVKKFIPLPPLFLVLVIILVLLGVWGWFYLSWSGGHAFFFQYLNKCSSIGYNAAIVEQLFKYLNILSLEVLDEGTLHHRRFRLPPLRFEVG